MKKKEKPKKGERYVNHLGEYCVIANTHPNITISICGENSRKEVWSVEDFLVMGEFKFKKIPYPKITRQNIGRHLLEYELNMIGKTTLDTKKEQDWFKKWKIKERELKFLKGYAIPLLRKTFKINKSKAESIFEWFWLQFGLKIKN